MRKILYLIIPLLLCERYQQLLKGSRLHLLEGENHILSKRRKEVIALSVDFLRHPSTP